MTIEYKLVRSNDPATLVYSSIRLNKEPQVGDLLYLQNDEVFYRVICRMMLMTPDDEFSSQHAETYYVVDEVTF